MTKVLIKVSARHCHLSQEDVEALFGDGYQLTKEVDIDQPGQFASKETISIQSAKDKIEGIRVVGPTRDQSQVEISLTDSYRLKVKPPLKDSVKTTGPNAIKIKLIGPAGEIERNCLIISQRHLHLSTKQAKQLELKNRQLISVKVEGDRGLIFNNVLVRVSDKYDKSVHIDTDEGNAAGINKQTEGEIV